MFFLALCLFAGPLSAQGTMVTTHTGLAGGYSAELQVARHRHYTVYAQGTVVQRGNQVAHTVFLRQGLGDGSIIYIDEAWSFGQQLNFDAVPPDRVCDGRRCIYNMGVLVFSRSDYAQLAQTGIELRLIGSEGPIDLSIPARVFAEAAREAGTVIR